MASLPGEVSTATGSLFASLGSVAISKVALTIAVAHTVAVTSTVVA